MTLSNLMSYLNQLRKRNKAKCLKFGSELYPVEISRNEHTLTYALINNDQLNKLNKISKLVDIKYEIEDITSDLLYGELDDIYKNDCIIMSIIRDFLMKNVHRGDVINKLKMLGITHLSDLDKEILLKAYKTNLD